MAKIMLVTSQYTGHGHMSIAEALNEQFGKLEGMQIDIVDGFSFMGSMGVNSSKLYNVITQRARFLWDAVFSATQKGDVVPETMALLVAERLKKYVLTTKPDLILTIHPMFVGCIIDVLEKNSIDIPVVCLEADIVNIHSAWCDSRVKMAICPTVEAMERSIELGMPDDKLIVLGFPTRERFCETARREILCAYNPENPPKCLMVGGGGGAGDIEEYTEAILRDTNAYLTVVCGSNAKLRDRLNDRFDAEYSDRLVTLGFVEDMENAFAACDIAVLRASPNSMYEAVVMARPMIITGALPGQEKDNPAFAENHSLGIVCPTPNDIARCMNELTGNNGGRYMELRDSMINFRDLDTAKKIAEYISDMVKNLSEVL